MYESVAIDNQRDDDGRQAKHPPGSTKDKSWQTA